MRNALLVPLLVSMMVGCTGPQGPAGPAGPAGAQGPAGADGMNGTNGTNGMDGMDGAMGAPGDAGLTQLDELALPGPAFYPENLHASADGTLYVGSLTTGAVVKFAPGEGKATQFLAAGTVRGVAGVLVDEVTQSLLICAVDATFSSAPTVKRYDLATGALEATFDFPGAGLPDGGVNPYVAFPNDLAFDSARRLYVTDSFGGKLWTVGSIDSNGTFAEWVAHSSLAPAMANTFGADGITWDGTGNFYVNNNNTGAIVRVARNTDGTAGAVTPLTVTPSLAHPDGQRQLDANTLAIVDNDGRLVTVAISGTAATVTPVANRLDAPTGLVKVGNSYWVTEGQITSSLLTGGNAHLPFLVRRITAY